MPTEVPKLATRLAASGHRLLLRLSTGEPPSCVGAPTALHLLEGICCDIGIAACAKPGKLFTRQRVVVVANDNEHHNGSTD